MGNNGGTAFVRINGKRVYLGKFGSAEAAQNYARCAAEWAISNTDPTTAGQPICNITVDTLAKESVSGGIDLVFHQRNERTDNHANAFLNMGWQLIAE
jgi:hypothetical protein